MRKILAVLSIAGLALMACGGASGPEDAVTGLFDAMKSGDVDAMMTYLPEETRAIIELLPEEAREEAFGDMSDFPEDLGFKVIGSDISEDGNSATVTIELTAEGESIETDVELLNENGNWVVAGGGFF